MRLREEAQQACETVERLQQSADTEREDLRQHVAVLEQECDGLRSELTSMNEKCEQLDQQAGIAI
jgi:septal ring factor EnvC (AmiA/AmiB activator)